MPQTRNTAGARCHSARVELIFLPGTRHRFLQQPSADTEKAVALMRDFIARL